MDTPLVWVDIDLKAIDHNICQLRRITDPGAGLMAVVKANAYGHGALEVAKQSIESGAVCLGVARISEGMLLRKAGISAQILILGYTPADFANALIEYDLTQTLFSLETAETLSDAANKQGKKISVHLKVDTGMGRLGFVSDPLIKGDREKAADKTFREVEAIARLSGLTLEGIFTHFATADSADKTYANEQFENFKILLNQINRAGIEIPVKHAANSAALIDMPETHLDMVRAGISLYGLYPSDEVDKDRIDLQPAMTFKSRIVQLKAVPTGFKVSYGCTCETKHPTTIATVPVGYADGYNRALSSCGFMLVKGVRAPVMGRICMDLTLLDVGHIPDVVLEDEVVIFGRMGDASIPVDEIATTLNTINYEVVSTITDRVKRIFLK